MLKLKSNIKAAYAHLLSSVLSSKDWEPRTGKTDVRLLRDIPEMILATQQWNNRNCALNPSKLLSSQLLPKYLFCCSSPAFLPQAQTSSAAGWLRGHSASISRGVQHPAGQSPEKPCLTSELALLWAEDRSTEPPEVAPRQNYPIILCSLCWFLRHLGFVFLEQIH